MRNNETVVNGQVKVFGRPGGGLTGLVARGSTHALSEALPFVVPNHIIRGALFHNCNSVTVEKNNGADGKVSRTLYKGLFYRAGPRVSMLPRTRRTRNPPPQNLDAHYTPLFLKSVAILNSHAMVCGVTLLRFLVGWAGLFRNRKTVAGVEKGMAALW